MQQRWSFGADHQNSHRLFDVRRTIFDVKAIAGNEFSFLAFSARRHPKSKTIRFRQRLFFNYEFKDSEGIIYEIKSQFVKGSRHHWHALFDSQHCLGCARALYDEIAIGEPTK
jgi:hypothetical protein